MPRLPAEIKITNRVQIPASEIELSYARSGGPGGQHVNKTASKVLLRWNARTSGALSAEDRALLEKRLETKLTKDGDLIVTSEKHRDQSRNVDDAVERFAVVVRRAIRRPTPRKKTRPSRASRERRLESKRHRSQRKQQRRAPPE